MKKIKSTKTILKKKNKKNHKKEKTNHMEKHCSNPHCFKEKKLQRWIFYQLHIKKNNKNNFEKETQKDKKKKREEEEDNFGRKNKKKHVGKVKAEFSISSILKK
jgi:hypothetical protein